MQASVIGKGVVGFAFAGLLPALGKSHPFRVFMDVTEAFRAIADEPGVALAAEVDEAASRARAVPRETQSLRALLATRVDASISEAAKELNISPRSLQRVLASHGSSFSDAVTEARFALAQNLLLTTEAKLAAIARRLGISERSLTLLSV